MASNLESNIEMTANNPVKTSQLNRLSCDKCQKISSCLPRDLSPLAVNEFSKIIGEALVLQRGEHLYRTGDTFDSIYLVRSGAIKTYCINASGEETILGLYLPTEIIGIDAIKQGIHPYSAVALETSSFCPISSEEITHVNQSSPEVYKQILKAIGKEFLEEEERMLLVLSKRSSMERVAAFLLNLSARFRRIGYSWQEFRLPFTRWEMGSYLGLTTETASRVMHRLQVEKIIKCNGRIITIMNPDALTHAAGSRGCSLLAC